MKRKSLREQILKLRKEGKTYNEISKTLKCSKSNISYHCGEGQKKKSKHRAQKNRGPNMICSKVWNFCRRELQGKSDGFQRERINGKPGKLLPKTFGYKDVIKKFGENTYCYLTGRPINLLEPKTYQFDHKIPPDKGGTSKIENLGIVCKEANLAKSNLLLSDFFQLCKDVLEYNGYRVSGP